MKRDIQIDERGVATAVGDLDPIVERAMDEALGLASPDLPLSGNELIDSLRREEIDRALNLDDVWQPKLVPEAAQAIEERIDRALSL